MESPGPLLAGPGEKAGPVALCPQASQDWVSSWLPGAFIEQTLSVGLEVPSQQMDLDRRIQMEGLRLVQTTDTSVGRSQGALLALCFSVFLGCVCTPVCTCAHMHVCAWVCLCVHLCRWSCVHV